VPPGRTFLGLGSLYNEGDGRSWNVHREGFPPMVGGKITGLLGIVSWGIWAYQPTTYIYRGMGKFRFCR